MKEYIRDKPQTVAFRLSDDDLRRMNAKIAVSGLSRMDYITKSVLQQEIHIFVGKFESDRLGVELKKLRRQLETMKDIEELDDTLKTCIALLEVVLETERGDSP